MLTYKDKILWLVIPVSALFTLSSLSLLSMHSNIFDLGVFLVHLSDYGELGWWKIFYGHSQPFIIPYSWFYKVWPNDIAPYMVLLLQSIFLIVPIYLVRLNYGSFYAFIYLLFFPIWFLGLNGFNIDHLVILILTIFFLASRNGKIGIATISALLLALVKEPYALQTIFCGLYLILFKLSLSRQSPKYSARATALLGIILIIFGSCYFYFVVNDIVPAVTLNGKNNSTSIAFGWMGDNINQWMLFVFKNIGLIFVEIIQSPAKMTYLFLLFGSFLFIPFLSIGALLIALPIIAISLLSKDPGIYGYGNHYTAGVVAPLFFSFIEGMRKLEKKLEISKFNFVKYLVLVVVLLSHISISPSPIGRLFWSEKIWKYSYKGYLENARDVMVKKAIKHHIPTSPDINVSVQNSVLSLNTIFRNNLLVFPQGVNTTKDIINIDNSFSWPPIKVVKKVLADYVVIDKKRPWFLVDKGCEWVYGRCSNNKKGEEYLEWIKKSQMVMETVFEKDGFIILKRNSKAE